MIKKLVTLLLISVPLFQTAFAQSHVEEQRIDRLFGLAKVWGTVKYFHPHLGYKEIDWDKALIEAIGKVNAARSGEEYAAAVNGMLTHAGDLNTFAAIRGADVRPLAGREAIRVQDGVYVLDGRQWRELAKAELPTALSNAKAIVLDLRSNEYLSSRDQQSFDYFLSTFLPKLLDSELYMGALRYRFMQGYAPQTPDAAYFGSNHRYVTTSRKPLAGQLKTKAPRMIVLVNEKTSGAQVISGLQSSEQILVLQEGQAEPAIETHKIDLPDGVIARMRTVEHVNADGSVGLVADRVVARSADEQTMIDAAVKLANDGWTKPVMQVNGTKSGEVLAKEQSDRPYREMEFPSSEYRMLALFRFWNIIENFYQYKHLIDKPWADVLAEYITKFEANKDAADYQITLGQLIAEMHDSHSAIAGPRRRLDERLGVYLPPFAARYLADQLVVAHVFDPTGGMKVGDTILQIDGQDEKVFSLGPLAAMPTSTLAEARMRVVRLALFRGHQDTTLDLVVRGLDGHRRKVRVLRSMRSNDSKRTEYSPIKRVSPVYEILPSGFGYIDMNRLEGKDLEDAWKRLSGAPGLIFDMRGYPGNVSAYAVARKLAIKDAVIFRTSEAFRSARDLGKEWMSNPSFTFDQFLGPPIGPGYRGRVVVLINEHAASAAESFCMAVKAVTNATFIGTPTAGANGGTVAMMLPGGWPVIFSTGDVRFPNGEQLQRRGVRPDIRVEPSAKGLAQGKDEVLEAAVRFLKNR